MNGTAKGTFEITSTPHPADEGMQAIGAMRITFRKVFQGDLTGTSAVEMMGMMDRELGSGAYVALEKFTGSLAGRSGGFCLQHSSTMDRNRPEQRISVVPDSGTGDLKGLSGSLTIDIVEKRHHYTFTFAIAG